MLISVVLCLLYHVRIPVFEERALSMRYGIDAGICHCELPVVFRLRGFVRTVCEESIEYFDLDYRVIGSVFHSFCLFQVKSIY